MVAGKQRQRAAGEDAVEQLPGDRLGPAEHRIGRLLHQQQLDLRLLVGAFADRRRDAVEARQAGERQAVELRAAGEQVDMAFDEAGQHRAAAGVDAFRAETGMRFDGRPGAHRQDATLGERHGLGTRLRPVHGQNAPILDDDLCWRCHGLPSRWS